MDYYGQATSELIARVTPFRDKALVPDLRHRTELCLLDSLSCFCAGLSLKHFQPSAIVAQSLFATKIQGLGLASCVSAFGMAYLYGQAANCLDYDDTLLGHPGSPIVGAVLSVGARGALPTENLLRGIAAGYEAHWLLSSAALPSSEQAALVRSVGVWDTVAASIAIAVALGVSDMMIDRIIGVAVAHSVLPYTAKWYERPVPSLKNNLGWVAAGAVLAADLAAEGQTGITNPLDGENGMWRMAGSDQWQCADFSNNKPAVMRVGFKRFPVCWFMQEYLKAFADLLMSLAKCEEIVEIVLYGPSNVEKFCEGELLGSADIAFSFPATFSLLVADIEPGPEWDSISSTSEHLRFTRVFRYQHSERKAIKLRTGSGSELEIPVGISDPFDLAPSGLDEHGVLDKHAALTDRIVQLEAAVALKGNPQEIPYGLYRAVEHLLAR
ncbi:MmgE/PrpD family protein [Burkholderia sp. Leaf177]|uniref:MmgE/PrpD family protein n=1 Tax=Burkholderia sp. Leaf177 TaxID=1736287 RepID=UPI000AC0B5E2|nr:MmgE/PrpD family protein [Burkholderia sp. Leaf177]